MQSVTLPFPPSVNRYWRSIGRGRVIISEAGRRYREEVAAIVRPLTRAAGGGAKKPPRLGLLLDAFPPDRRRRDLDNMCKAPLDAMQSGGLYDDDSQIDILMIRRREQLPGGRLHALLYHNPPAKCPYCGHALDGKHNVSAEGYES